MRKTILTITVVFLATQFGLSYQSLPKQLPKPKAIDPIVLSQKTKEAFVTTENAHRLSWKTYLANLQGAVSHATQQDLSAAKDLHSLLMQMDASLIEDREQQFSIRHYQGIIDTFQSRYHLKRLEDASLNQIQDFYKKFSNRSPRDYYILPTFAIWVTDSLSAVVPLDNPTAYFENPQLSALAYDMMALVDHNMTLNIISHYLGDVAKSYDNPNLIRSFFQKWRTQKGAALISVQDADELESFIWSFMK